MFVFITNFQVQGLCGNFNDNEADDFQTPSGGVVEASAYIFGNSWKTQAMCIDPEEIIVSYIINSI